MPADSLGNSALNPKPLNPKPVSDFDPETTPSVTPSFGPAGFRVYRVIRFRALNP